MSTTVAPETEKSRKDHRKGSKPVASDRTSAENRPSWTVST